MKKKQRDQPTYAAYQKQRAKRDPNLARATKAADFAIAKRMREAREEADMTLMQLAVVIGVSYQQAQKYEGGINRVAASTLIEIGKAFGCDPRWLLTGDRWRSDEKPSA